MPKSLNNKLYTPFNSEIRKAVKLAKFKGSLNIERTNTPFINELGEGQKWNVKNA